METYLIGSLPSSPQPRRVTPWWHWALLFLSVSWVLGAILVPNFCHHGCGGPLTACKSNCKNLATALEMYASDNQGQYPPRLSWLIPGRYLNRIPTCPAEGRDTYSASYRVTTRAGRFSFCCRGDNHRKSYQGLDRDSRNFPAYDSDLGLLDHP